MEEITAALAILKQAMRLEEEGRAFYLQAAETTGDEEGKETFRALADDEQHHLRLIQRQHDALSSENKWTSSPEIKPTHIDMDKPLFPKGKEALEKAVKAKSRDTDAMLFGLEIENKSYDLYRTAALATTNPLGKAMFEFLAGEERGHFNILMMRYESLAGPVAWST